MVSHGILPPHGPHPCVGRRCSHPLEDHVATPELATRDEAVVWCTRCRRHEVRRARVWPFGSRRASTPYGS